MTTPLVVELKRVTFIIGFDQHGKPMALPISKNEFKRITYDRSEGIVSVIATNPNDDMVVHIDYPVDKYMAIEYVEVDPLENIRALKPLNLVAEPGLYTFSAPDKEKPKRINKVDTKGIDVT